jgi:NodT family efflux transporter outer membrane factor (OMF) lipoprotein
VLLGDQPGALLAELAPQGPIPGIPALVAIGGPAELLRRRPDIRAAERNVAAANARVGVATADLYPRFRLLGSIGVQAADFANLFDANSRFFSIGPQMQWNVFDAGRIRGNIAVQDARTEQAAARYQQVVLLAFEEAENAVVNYAREQERMRLLQEAVAAAQRAMDISSELYTRGLVDFFSVLDTQRTLFVQQDALVQSQRNVTANLIAVYKALGGGWEEFDPREDEETTPASLPEPPPEPESAPMN